MDRLQYLEENLPLKSKKWLKFTECIPPANVCKEIYSMTTGINTYEGFIGKLSEYYGCKPMSLHVDKTINPKYSAIYYPNLNEARTRTKTVGFKTVLHEFFHHLVNLKVVVVNKDEEEKYADKYARIFMQRAGI